MKANGFSDQELDQIKQLMSQAQFADAEQRIKILESSQRLSKEKQLALKYLKSTLSLKIGKIVEGKQLAEQLLEESRKLNNQLLEIDALNNLMWASNMSGDHDYGLQLSIGGEKLLEMFSQDQKSLELLAKEASFFFYKGLLLVNKDESNQALTSLSRSLSLSNMIGDKSLIADALHGMGHYYSTMSEWDQALVNYQQSLVIYEELGNQQFIAHSLSEIGAVYLSKGELDQSHEYYQKSLSISQALDDPLETASVLRNIGTIFSYKGDLDKSIEFYTRSLALNEKIGNQRGISVDLNNIGCILSEKGDPESAIEYFKRSLEFSRKISNESIIVETLSSIIHHLINELPSDTVRSYLAELEEINTRKKDIPFINQKYRLAKAIFLKAQGRLSDKMTAQILFRQIANEDIVWFELTVVSMNSLSELLLLELKLTGDEAVLVELKTLVERLATIAKNQNSFWIQAQAYLIQSKIALMELDLERAQYLLIQAEQIAVEKGLKKLAKVISVEQDLFKTQLNQWNRIIKQNLPISEMVELTQVSSLLERMIHKTLYHSDEAIMEYAKEARNLIETWQEKSRE